MLCFWYTIYTIFNLIQSTALSKSIFELIADLSAIDKTLYKADSFNT